MGSPSSRETAQSSKVVNATNTLYPAGQSRRQSEVEGGVSIRILYRPNIEQERRMRTTRREVPVIGALLLLAVHFDLSAVQVQRHPLRTPFDIFGRRDQLAIKRGRTGQVGAVREQRRFEGSEVLGFLPVWQQHSRCQTRSGCSSDDQVRA